MGRTLPDFQCIVQALNFELPCTCCSIYILHLGGWEEGGWGGSVGGEQRVGLKQGMSLENVCCC
jgi:hypothetical protein